MNLTTTLLATKAGGTQGIISMVVIYASYHCNFLVLCN